MKRAQNPAMPAEAGPEAAQPARHDPRESGRRRRTRYDAQFDVNAPDAAAAPAAGVHTWRHAVAATGLPPWPVVAAHVLTVAKHEADLARPNPELVGVTEIARILGTTRNRAWQVTRKPGFPQPLALLAGGPVWTLPVVTRFLEEWRRRPGRPPATRTVNTTAA